jgi:hypothetical protein
MYITSNTSESVWEDPYYTTTITIPGLFKEISGLLESTSYYIRVYAKNNLGTSTEYATFYSSSDGVTETTVKTAASEVIDIYVPKNFTQRLSQSVTL